jgi:hypothetical protein
MGTKKASGALARPTARVPSYPTKVVCGLALSITMGAAASCGGGPGEYENGYRRDASSADTRPDVPVDRAAVDASDGDQGAVVGASADDANSDD